MFPGVFRVINSPKLVSFLRSKSGKPVARLSRSRKLAIATVKKRPVFGRLTRETGLGEPSAKQSPMKSAVFFERDGILNHAGVERNHQVSPLTLEQFKVNEDAVEPLRKLKAAGFLLIATTNQPGLSRGYQSRRELDLMHGILRRRFPLDDLLLCAHDETDRCPCRRPKAGLLLEAAFKWHLDLERSYVVSDKWQDAHAAHVVGATSFVLRSPWLGTSHHDFVVDSLAEMVDRILAVHSESVLVMNQL